MTPQELKNSILQLAVQGKLVEQRPEEGNAEELFKKIQEEKQRLIAEKKIKKEKPLPEITEDEKPFDIPESWKWVRVGQCFANKTGLSYKKDALDIQSDKMVRVLRGGNILDLNYVLKPDDIWISAEFVKTELYLQRNTIITPAVTSLEHIGKMGRIDSNYSDMVVGGFVLMLIPHYPEDTLSKYLLYAMSSRYFRDCCRNIVNKSGQAFYNLSREKLMQLCVPLPPLAEQKRIVAKIEELLPLVDRYEQAWSKLEQFNKRFPEDMKKSLLQYAIQGKLVEQRPEEGTAEELYKKIQEEKQRLIAEKKIKKEKPLPEITDDEKPFDIPESWKWVRLGAASEIQSSKRVFEKDYVPDGIPFFRSKEIGDLYRGEEIQTQLFITREHYEQLKKDYGAPKMGDILLTSVGTIGNTWICDGREFYYKDGNITQICSNEFMYPRFLQFYIESPLFLEQAHTTVSGTAYNALTIIKLKRMLLPLPPLAEQKRIVEKLKQLLPLCERLK